jgi:hypothetical protein
MRHRLQANRLVKPLCVVKQAHARGWGWWGAVAPWSPTALPVSGHRERSIAAWLIGGLFALNFLVRGLIGLGGTAYDYYKYQVGTPTTATIDHCVSSGKSSTCYGTWSVGGVSQTGEIRGGLPSGPRVGRSLDVHVNGGKAYTADSVGGLFCGA